MLFVHNESIWEYISTIRAGHAVARRDGKADALAEPKIVCDVLNVDLCSRIAWKMTALGESPRDRPRRRHCRQGHNRTAADPVVDTEFGSCDRGRV